MTCRCAAAAAYEIAWRRDKRAQTSAIFSETGFGKKQILPPGDISIRRSPMPTASHPNDEPAFDADATNAMGRAFEDACSTLQVAAHDTPGRLAIAARIIDLARAGVTDANALHARVVKEAHAQG